MKIYSKYHDYYDTIQMYGSDPLCVYNRINTQHTFESLKIKLTDIRNVWMRSIKSHQLCFAAVGFCGKIYPYITISTMTRTNTKISYFYRYDDVREYLYHDIDTNEEHLRSHINHIKTINDFFSYPFYEFKSLFVDYHIPYFHVSLFDEIVEFNHSLKDCQFYKMFDPVSTYQEISMYVSGILGGNSPKLIQIDDKSMLYKKGFDDMSFKKQPQKRK